MAKRTQKADIKIRLNEALRAKIEKAAKVRGVSMNAEMIDRLSDSFDKRTERDRLIEEWGRDVFTLAQSLAQSLWHIERFTGKRWIEDDQTDALFRRTADQLFLNYRALVMREPGDTPSGNIKDMSPGDQAKAFAAAGGLSPPRPRTDLAPGYLEAERKQSLAEWKRWMSGKNGSDK